MKKKTVVITGGANGIGASIAKLFAIKKYNVVIIDNDLSSINKIDDNNIFCYYADISSESQISCVIYDIHKKFDYIDVLINNAAKQVVSSFDDINYCDWTRVVDINLNGTFLVIKNAINFMHEKSTILNILSVHHDKPRLDKYSYDVTKAAVAMLTKEFALEFSNRGITINALSFGAVNTNMNRDWINNIEIAHNVLSKVPLCKIFEPEEIASFAYTIINDFSLYTTGSIFTIDAGRSLM